MKKYLVDVAPWNRSLVFLTEKDLERSTGYQRATENGCFGLNSEKAIQRFTSDTNWEVEVIFQIEGKIAP
jgi:hypothetical protein